MGAKKTPGGTGARVRVALVEDQQMLAKLLGGWLARQRCFEFIGCAESGAKARLLCLAANPEVVVVDIELPDGGLELGRELVRKIPALRVVSVSGQTDPYTVWRVRESGMHGFVDKGQDLSSLIKAILAVASGATYFSSVFNDVEKERLGQADAFHKILSEREQTVLQGVAAGCSDPVMADRFDLCVSTVAVHRKHIRQKLELHSDRELVAYARHWGLDRTIA
jgi:DNA-binding NarL/FixJ family response regulator